MAAIVPSLSKPDASLASIQASVVQIITLLEQHNLTGAETPALKTGDLASPPAIGGTNPGDGNFARIRATGAVPNPPRPGFRYAGMGAEHLIGSTDLTGAAQSIPLPGDTRFAYIVARLRHCRSVNNNIDLWLRVNAGSGVDTGANYNWALEVSTSAAVQAPGGSAGDTKINLSAADGVSNTATKGWTGKLVFQDPGETAHHKVVTVTETGWRAASGNDLQAQGAGFYLGSASALTAFQLLWSDGSNFAEGKCDLYGFLAV